MSKANSVISIITGTLVLFVAAGAFWLSFEALRDLAHQVGIATQRAWLYPIIIDGAIIIFSLSVLRASLNRENPLYPWVLVGSFTALSVILNIVHAQIDLLARFLAAIPPVALFLSFELLMGQIRAIVERLDAVKSLQEISANIEVTRSELDALLSDKSNLQDKLNGNIQNLEDKKSALQDEIRELRTAKRHTQASGTGSIAQARQARADKKTLAMKALLDHVKTNPQATLSEMAQAIGRAKSTAGSYVSELQDHGLLSKDEDGWQVSTLPEGETNGYVLTR
ncbi:MAG: DUF2637 domain-containing protein [Anaerolineales bacterium]|nr:DUF2637 domain-containing protein [Anaerolineales bacterium]